MRYVPASLAVIFGGTAVAIACYITQSGLPIWGLLAITVLATELMPSDKK